MPSSPATASRALRPPARRGGQVYADGSACVCWDDGEPQEAGLGHERTAQPAGGGRRLSPKLQTRPLTAIKEAQELVDGIVAQLLSTDEMVLHLMSGVTRRRASTITRSTSPSSACCWPKRPGFTEEEMKQVGFAALVHDIGMLRISTQILRKTEPLTRPELNLLKQHTRYGHELLDLTKDCPDTAKKVVLLHHHERLDGSGFPRGPQG